MRKEMSKQEVLEESGNIIMPPTLRPKGYGRRNPHESQYTKKVKSRSEHTSNAINKGLSKINILINKGIDKKYNSSKAKSLIEKAKQFIKGE